MTGSAFNRFFQQAKTTESLERIPDGNVEFEFRKHLAKTIPVSSAFVVWIAQW